jgi:hypothetical protein
LIEDVIAVSRGHAEIERIGGEIERETLTGARDDFRSRQSPGLGSRFGGHVHDSVSN